MKLTRWITETSCTNEHVDFCNYAYLEVNQEFIELVRRRVAIVDRIKEEDPSFRELSFTDYSAIYFDHGYDEADVPKEIGEVAEEGLTDGDWAAVGSALPDDSAARTEYDRMVIGWSGDFWFESNPKHCDFQISTPSLTVEQLEYMLEDKSVPAEA